MHGRCRNPLLFALLAILVCPPHGAGAAFQDGWVEVRSPHFAVVSDAGEERARRVAAMLETIRQVYVDALPTVAPQQGPPLEVFAVKDRDGLRELLPQYAERDRSRMPLGVYLRTADKNFIVLLEVADTENPYETVFHEYFHSVALPVIPWAPMWLHEGMAEFWENTLIKRDTVETGRPSEVNLQILGDEPWMSFTDLLSADRALTNTMSARQTSVFYAQSWALVHYMMLGDRTGRLRNAITPYLQHTMTGQTSVDAFRVAFGDLEDVEREVRRYVERVRFQALEFDKPQYIDADGYAATALTADHLSARRGSYFVHVGLHEEGRAELDRAFQLNPDEALAHEALGLLHYRTDRPDEAQLSFEKAASLNGTLFLSRYYLALLEGASGLDAAGVGRVREHLERAVQMNPFHAPSLARLSMMYVSADEQVELALRLARRAAAVSPNDPFVHVAQGITAKAQGFMEEARVAMETALRLAPEYEFARTQLEEIRQIEEYPMAGSWAFEGVQAWLQIHVDGRALRCGIATSGIARQEGQLDGSLITWKISAPDGSVAESTDTVSVSGGKLRFDNGQDELVLRRVAGLPPVCEPMFN